MTHSHLRSGNQLNRVARRWRKALVPALAVLLLSLPLPNRVEAAAGDLDLTFGVGGRVNTDFFGGDDEGKAIAIQPDSKILVAGSVLRFGFDFGIARYNADGSLDSSFGAGGRVATSFFGDDDIPEDIALQQDGKIVVAGHADQGFSSDFAIARYNSNGALDTSFGSGGKVTTDFFGGEDGATHIAIQTDGRIVLGGDCQAITGFPSPALARYNSNGSLDTSFGSGGRVTIDFFSLGGSFGSIALQNDGKIVAGGSRPQEATSYDFFLARFNTNGALDSSFGSGGLVTTDFLGGRDLLGDIAIQSDGKIVAAGVTFPNDFALVRYDTNGSLDSSFGSGGKVVTDFFVGSDSASGVAIQSNGQIVVAGTCFVGSVIPPHFAVARYHTNGSLDASFGSGGKVLGLVGFAVDVAIQNDGGILAAGSAAFAGHTDFVLERYKGDSFDLCLQDDGSGSLLQLNSTTGAYLFTNCGGVTITGMGTLTKRGGGLTLQDFSVDRKVLAKIDTAVNRASAGIQIYSQGATFTITDRNTINNTCACR